MRTLFYLVLFFISGVLFISCKKGDTGSPGTDGNANAVQYSFGVQNFEAEVVRTLRVATTEDTMNRSQWFVYLYHDVVALWYAVPGYGYANATQYRVGIGFFTGKVNLFVNRLGSGEVYSKARVIRIYANTVMSGGRTTPGSLNGNGLPDIDFTDYEAVRRYYRLPS